MRGILGAIVFAVAHALLPAAPAVAGEPVAALVPTGLPDALAPVATTLVVAADPHPTAIAQVMPRRISPVPPPVPGPRTRPDRSWPTAGPVSTRVGEPRVRLGVPVVRISARPGGAVHAPADGVVVYADRLTMIGVVLIIAHDDEYHSVLAGLDTLHIEVGEGVEAGREVGRMGASDAPLELHLELHHNGRPIDPLPWLGVRVAGERHS